jgi:hypothetical protein
MFGNERRKKPALDSQQVALLGAIVIACKTFKIPLPDKFIFEYYYILRYMALQPFSKEHFKQTESLHGNKVVN